MLMHEKSDVGTLLTSPPLMLALLLILFSCDIIGSQQSIQKGKTYLEIVDIEYAYSQIQ